MALDTRISLHKLEVFCTVVEVGSVSRAAERLYVAQPVVSAHIKSLEERVGAKLLQRRENRMILTEAGRAAYAWARDVLTRSREMEREVQGLEDGSQGAAVIASSMTAGSYLLPEILAAFRRDRPGAQLTLTTSDPEHATAAVQAGECDFAVLIAEEDQIDRRDLRLSRVADEPLVLVAGVGHRPAGNELAVNELAALPFVSSPGRLSRQRMVDRQLAELGLSSTEVVIELGHAESMKRAVRSGLGVAFLFLSSVEEELERGELREITVRDARMTAPVLLVQREDKRFTPMQQHLVDTVRDELIAHSVASAARRSVPKQLAG
jgi:DNA-binding transcriptional LysR family regulator